MGASELAYHLRDSGSNSTIKHVGQYLSRSGFRHQTSKGFRRVQFHFLGNACHAMIECAAENSRECERVIHLIREIRASCRNNDRTSLFRFVRHNFRRRIREREDDRPLIHEFDVGGGCKPWTGDADKHICFLERDAQSAGEILRIRKSRELRLMPRKVGAMNADETLAIEY